MRCCFVALVASLLSIAFYPRAAHAQEAKGPWESRLVSVVTPFGFTPYGLAGIAAGITPIRWLTVEAGAGASLYGPQLVLEPRGRLFVSRKVAFMAGLGVSTGRHVDESPLDLCGLIFIPVLYDTNRPGCPQPWRRDWAHAVWANALVGVEGRTGVGFEWRIFAGFGELMNPHANTCSGPCPPPTRFRGYGGVAIGYAFGGAQSQAPQRPREE
jgi:hypothetical protein